MKIPRRRNLDGHAKAKIAYMVAALPPAFLATAYLWMISDSAPRKWAENNRIVPSIHTTP